MKDWFDTYFGYTDDPHEYFSDIQHLSAVGLFIVSAGLLMLELVFNFFDPALFVMVGIGLVWGLYGTWTYHRKKTQS